MHPSGVAKSSTSFGWGKGKKVTAAGLQVTLCDPIWHVISRSSEAISTNCYTHLLYLLTLEDKSWNIRTISKQSTALKLNLERKQKKYTENTPKPHKLVNPFMKKTC